MSQRDLVAELRAARVEAPPEGRERVRLTAAVAPAPRRRVTWRRALVVAVPIAAAVAAAVVFTRPSGNERATLTLQGGANGSKRAVPAAPAPKTSTATFSAHARSAAGELSVPPTKARVQVYGATLSLRVATAPRVSDAVKRALRIMTALGGYPTAVHAQTSGRQATADLTLKVPREHVEAALMRLSQLGTITAEQVDVTDKQAGLNKTGRLIARLRKELAALRADSARAAQIAALTARIAALQRAEAATRRSAHYATIRLHLETPAPPAPRSHHGHGPLHGVVVALRWLGIGAVYALAIGVPVLVVLVLVWLAVRLVRRRREETLLSRP
jgi:hypothetical protein